MTWQDYLAREVMTARQRIGLTQEELAELVGCSRSYICKIETGKAQYPPKNKWLESLATHLDLNQESLEIACGRIPERLRKEAIAGLKRREAKPNQPNQEG